MSAFRGSERGNTFTDEPQGSNDSNRQSSERGDPMDESPGTDDSNRNSFESGNPINVSPGKDDSSRHSSERGDPMDVSPGKDDSSRQSFSESSLESSFKASRSPTHALQQPPSPRHTTTDSGGDGASTSSNDTTDSGGESPLQVLRHLLSTEEYTENILEADQNTLTAGEKRTLMRIARRFNPAHGQKRKRDRREGAEEGRRQRPRPASINTWAAILRLDQLALPAFIRRHLAHDPAGQAHVFLNDPCSLKEKNGIRGSRPNESNSFLCSLRYSKQVEYRSELDRARWLFAMLFFYDFITNRYPGASGRVGPIMEQDIKDCFARTNPPDLVLADTLDDLRKYSLRGRRLALICTRFGAGAILVLANELSQDFLDNKCALSGIPHDRAMEHLQQLGLATLAEESRANRLGNNVRRELLEQWSLPG